MRHPSQLDHNSSKGPYVHQHSQSLLVNISSWWQRWVKVRGRDAPCARTWAGGDTLSWPAILIGQPSPPFQDSRGGARGNDLVSGTPLTGQLSPPGTDHVVPFADELQKCEKHGDISLFWGSNPIESALPSLPFPRSISNAPLQPLAQFRASWVRAIYLGKEPQYSIVPSSSSSTFGDAISVSLEWLAFLDLNCNVLERCAHTAVPADGLLQTRDAQK